MMQQVQSMMLFGAMFLVLALAGCGSALAAPAAFPDDAPWFNVSQPLTWQDLRGRAVLLDFFTPGCINCIHMVPVEDKLARQFGKQLVIIGVDSPKFTDSGTQSGLKDFLAVHHVSHPVVLDTQHRIWQDWHAVAWPTFVLVGPQGKQQGRFIGEQTVAELAQPIKAALAQAPTANTLAPLPLQALAAAGGSLDAPAGIAVSAKRVAISDTGHNRIVLATRQGQVTAVIGSSCAGTANGGYAQAQFSRPHGLTFHAGKLYVAGTTGQKVRVIKLRQKKVATLAGSGERSYVRGGQFDALNIALNSPWDVQWVNDKLYVSMAGDHDIWRYDPASKQIGPWFGNGREGLRDGMRQRAEFAQPSGLDAHGGTLYDADPESSSVRAIDIDSGQVQTLIGQGLFRFGLRDGAARSALLQHDQDLVWVAGSLYIADTFNDALRRLNLKTNRVSTLAQNLSHPQAIAALSPNQLLLAEAGANRIVAVNLASGQVTPWQLKGLQPAVCPAGSQQPTGRAGTG